MRFVDRSKQTAPACLTEAKQAGQRELARARKKYTSANPPSTFTFRAYKEDDVRHAMERLFHGKCAYCESRYDITAPVDIEHFRPKGEVEGEIHTGYWWLAADWENLLPSCIDCNRRRYQHSPTLLASVTAVLDSSPTGFSRDYQTGKHSSFPLAPGGVRMTTEPMGTKRKDATKAELALLIDPTSDRPEDHLQHYIDRHSPMGLVLPTGGSAVSFPPFAFEGAKDAMAIEKAARAAHLSPRGSVSIQVYGLNRLGLVQERTRLLRRLELLSELILKLFTMEADLDDLATGEADPVKHQKLTALAKQANALAHRALSEVRLAGADEAPFTSLAKAWIADFRRELAPGVI
ncbi:HNH endonuclease [Brevundimonas subvibrioides]|uniref:HNH nuclease n=1 Tax=Brevundimonas subvibrioides (strain ATCC 15264 / DSM 4735 / LMG 14903 / NBRC 16000 / CB 81) TaxID=633149 RepID=D9QNI4_BRESC|nr:HNH endonuclease [Brevundimonas subvibrioides]ADL02219.1 HNH nuclease [Brevundimonas subvibrioides ATCC 15264]